MRLHRLRLTNFRQYLELDLTFDDGITAIIGANGSGKSTLLEAICWALYGADALRSNVAEVRPLFLSLLDGATGRAQGTNPRAVLTFSLSGTVYEVERTPQGARLYRLQPEREAIADGTKAVNLSVQRLLGGMTYRQFLTSFFAQQGELEFLNFDKARRREEVLRMLGLERVTRSVKWMEEELARQRAELRGKQSALPDPDMVKAQLEQAQAELDAARDQLQTAERTFANARAEWERWKPAFEQWSARKTAYDSLRMQARLLEQNAQTQEGELQHLARELEEAQAARERIEQLRPQGERYKQVREQLRQMEDLQRYAQRRAELQVQLENWFRQAQEREQQVQQVEADLNRLLSEKKQLDAQEQHLRELQEQATQAQQLQKRLEELDKLSVDVQKQVAALKAKKTALKEQQKQLLEQIALLEETEREEERLAALVQEATGRVHELETELSRLERQRASAIASAAAEAENVRRQMRELEERRQKVEALGPEGECPVCTRRLGEEYASVVSHFEQELREAERRLQAALSRQAEAERDTEAIEQCRANLQEARDDLQRYQQQLARLRERLRQRESWIREEQNLQQQIQAVQKQQEQISASYSAEEHEKVRRQVEQLQPIVQQALTEQQVWRERYNVWLRDMQKVQNQLRELSDALEQSRRAIQSAEVELQQLPTGYDALLHEQLRQERDELQPAWDEAIALHPVAKRLPELQARFQEAQTALKATQEQLQQTHQQLQSLAYDEKEYLQVTERFAECERALREAETQVQVLRERVTQKEAQLASAQEQWQRVQQQLHELRQLQHAVLCDETTRDWLREFADLLNGEIAPELQERAGELLNLLTDGRYMQLQMSEDFEFTLLDEGRPKPIISGGEEDIVNLSLRLAMAEMICERSGQPLGLLVLDEVFGSLDADRRENTLQLLRRLRERFAQIILISHIEEIQAGADRCLRVDYDPSRHRSTVREVSSFTAEELLTDEEPAEMVAAQPAPQQWGGLFDS
ncbi:MAG: SMC family ATPase [Armatimonadota bacterium]|nr:SMC family ATPase [bacterium]MCS7308671.1 SMC family ATPase [Armatimonadota bacterium]MDW8289435.1 SMC family ATPase [Armatimonadota bacterium]